MTVEEIDSEIAEAIGAHGVWKLRLRTAAQMQDEKLNPAEIGSSGLCRLGQWLARVPDDAPGVAHLPRVMALHAEFHTAAADVARMILEGRKAEGIAALHSGPFAETSAALSLALAEWRREVIGTQG